LGRPLSHGCVRLAVPNARQLFDWVEKHGATIEITGGARRAAGRQEAERQEGGRQAAERPRMTRRPRPIYEEPSFGFGMESYSPY
jgi:hypothetical protein